MAGQRDGDMTGEDPVSSTAEGDDDPGTAALAEAGTGAAAEDDADEDLPPLRPPPEAADDTPVTDAAPEDNLGFPDA